MFNRFHFYKSTGKKDRKIFGSHYRQENITLLLQANIGNYFLISKLSHFDAEI